MANKTISQIEVNNETYDLMDANILNKIYPVGAIFLSVVNTNPQTYMIGTTWVAWGSGRVPVGVNTSNANFNTVEKTGGADSHSYTPAGSVTQPSFTGTKATLSHSGGAVQNHTLTVSQIPSHNHGQQFAHDGSGDPVGGDSRVYARGTISNTNIVTTNTGGGGAHNHGFTQPTAHTYTPAGSVSKPTFSGTAATQSHLQQYITCYMWKRTA